MQEYPFGPTREDEMTAQSEDSATRRRARAAARRTQESPAGAVARLGGYAAGHTPAAALKAPPPSVCGPLVVIEWDDTTNIAGWITPGEVVEFAKGGSWRCFNVGWLVHEDDECVVVSARRATDDERHVGLTERIPKRAIVSRYLPGNQGSSL